MLGGVHILEHILTSKGNRDEENKMVLFIRNELEQEVNKKCKYNSWSSAAAAPCYPSEPSRCRSSSGFTAAGPETLTSSQTSALGCKQPES